MLEKENLTPFQIQLLLYYLTAEPSKRTVTDSARSLNVSKWVVTRTLDIIIINIKKNASVVRKRVSDFQKNFLKHTGNRMVTGCQ